MEPTGAILEKFRLDGKKALVIGASTGLGRAMAEALAEAGADLALSSRNRDRLEEVAAYAENLGRRAFALPCDVSDPDRLRSLVESAEKQLGRLDILVNSAGRVYRAHPEEFPEEEWDRVIAVNLKSVFIACQEAGRRMIARRSGKIINIASMLSFTGGILVPAYAASKGGVAQLTKALANEWAQYNVQVNAIAPGYFKTAMTRDIYEDPVRNREILDRIPAGRWGDPADLKGAVVFLASAASDYMSGHILVVDGGWLGR